MTHSETSSEHHENKGFGTIAKGTYHDTRETSNEKATKSDRKLMKFDEKHDISGTVGDIVSRSFFSNTLILKRMTKSDSLVPLIG